VEELIAVLNTEEIFGRFENVQTMAMGGGEGGEKQDKHLPPLKCCKKHKIKDKSEIY
jgi:hypothetical protein